MQLHNWDSHSLFCYLSYAHWQRLRYLYLAQTVLEFFHSTGVSPAESLEKSQLGYTPHERVIFKLVQNWLLNTAKMPVLDSHWYINSEVEHKTVVLKLLYFGLRVCQKSKLTLQKGHDYCSKDVTVQLQNKVGHWYKGHPFRTRYTETSSY